MALSSYLRCAARSSIFLSRAAYRTSKTDPLQLNESDVGLFYTIDGADYDDYLHHFFSRRHRRLNECFDDKSLMVRKPALEVISCLSELDFSRPMPRFIFYGYRGTGHSSQLAHITHWCGRQGWLLVQNHNLYSYLRYTPDLSKSSFRPGYWDTPTISSIWLKSFCEMNKKWLSKHQPKITSEVVWNLNESNAPGTSWESILQFGMARPKYATDVIGVILREVRKQASSSIGASDGGMRVLVCIDGINALWSKRTRLRDSESREIGAEDLSLFHIMRRLIRNDWCNSALIGSVSTKSSWSSERISPLPRYLFMSEGWKAVEPFVPILVDRLSHTEAYNFLEYLRDAGWITNTAAEKEMVKREILALCDGNPKEMVNVTSEW